MDEEFCNPGLHMAKEHHRANDMVEERCVTSMDAMIEGQTDDGPRSCSTQMGFSGFPDSQRKIYGDSGQRDCHVSERRPSQDREGGVVAFSGLHSTNQRTVHMTRTSRTPWDSG